MNAQASVIATLTADLAAARLEITSLKDENTMLTAQMVVDASRIKRLLGNVPVPPRRVWASI